MKILLLTPGTGNFYCGSCLHDEALARGLKRLGHDTQITALYLPLMLDHKEGVDGDDVHMGGINLYLQSKLPAFRHLPGFAQRWLDKPGLLRKAAGRADMTSPAELGRMTEQMLLGEHGKTKQEIAKLIDYLSEAGKPDIVVLNNALLLGLVEPLRETLGCVVACTLQGEDTFLDSLPEPWCGRAWDLLSGCAKQADLFLPVSRYHGGLMSERLSLPSDKVRVVYNGIEADHFTPQDAPPDPPVIGYLARLCENKGLPTLVDAYIHMNQHGIDHGAHLHLVGSATPGDSACISEQRDKLAEAGLIARLRIDTNVSFADKLAHLRGMTVLSVPATYGESFGLYVLEANLVGVPAVEPDHAGLAEVIGLTGGGILCQPDDPASLAESLASLLADEDKRRSLGEAGRQAVLERFTAKHMAESVASALETICQATS